MAEIYSGTKFQTEFARRGSPSDERIGELTERCHRWAALGVAGDAVGNLSVRTAGGFLISRTAGRLDTITSREFVEVLKVDIAKSRLTVAGLYEPSSESMMHAGIYAARPEVNAVFHGHSGQLLAAAERLGLPITEREQPYGTPELVAGILKVLDGHKLVIMRGHGFVSLGATMEEAGRNAEEILNRCARS
jgi:ribulose-5-phosphate 4-epimerase/fuculose-1-phosphate aldolase